MLKWIPDFLSLSRIALAIFFTHAFVYEKFNLALFLFSIAALTDFFDGYIARKFQVCSKFGSMIDPLADKILMFSAYAIFCYAELISSFTASLVIGRDLLILATVIAGLIAKIDLKFAPLWSSKVNTTIQLAFVIIVLACKSFSINISLATLELIVCLSTIYSGIEYVVKYRWIKDELFK